MALVILLLSRPVSAEPVTVLAMGDSLTQGYGLAAPEGFVPQLENWLQDQGVEAVLINAGVSGDTTSGGAARVEWSLTPEVDAMIVTLGGNDLLRGIDPAVSRKNIEAILTVAEKQEMKVLLVGMPVPGNFGPEYKLAYDAIYPELAKAHGALFYENFFMGLGEGTLQEQQIFFQADGIHPNAEGVMRIVEGIGPSVIRLIDAAK